ncbi:MAG: transposase [Patescibacteria group bacterium]|nr:transposase [Patescibacteria group bacterium]
MPYRKTIFHKGGYYHIYNRGVEKRTIFVDYADYKNFTNILRYYLILREKGKESPVLSARMGLSNLGKFREKVSLIAYTLMPNHFHFILKQLDQEKSISNFMRTIGTTYVMYFNQKYERVGSLFQGRFKAREVADDADLLNLSRYIHLNPCQSGIVRNPEDYPWSSYHIYIGNEPNNLINTNPTLDQLPEPKNVEYKKFTEAPITEPEKLNLKYLMLD